MLTIHTDPSVYSPREDTYLLLEALQNENLSGCGLELGTGTGFVALHIYHHFKEFTAADISRKAVELAEKNAQINNIDTIHFVQSDLFSNISGHYNAIIFNPPYVPADEPFTTMEDYAYHGGEDGRKIIDIFLSQVLDYLYPESTVYLLQSSLSGIEKTEHMVQLMNCTSTIIIRKPLFFEELVVFKIRRKPHDQT